MMLKEVMLGEVSEVKAGNSAPQDEVFFENGCYPFVRTSDVGAIKVGRLTSARDLLNEKGIKKLKLFKKGTVLFPKSGASTFLNHRVILSMDAYVSSHLATIKANNEYLLDDYIWYYLQTIDAAQLVADSAYPSLQANTIKEITIPPRIKKVKHVYHLYIIFAKKRDQLYKYCLKKGIEAKIHYPTPIYRQEPFLKIGYKKGMFPITDSHVKKIISFPCDQHLKNQELQYIVSTVKKFYK